MAEEMLIILISASQRENKEELDLPFGETILLSQRRSRREAPTVKTHTRGALTRTRCGCTSPAPPPDGFFIWRAGVEQQKHLGWTPGGLDSCRSAERHAHTSVFFNVIQWLIDNNVCSAGNEPCRRSQRRPFEGNRMDSVEPEYLRDDDDGSHLGSWVDLELGVCTVLAGCLDKGWSV